VYVVVLTLVSVDVDSVLFVDQQQLTQYAHFLQTRIIIVLSDVNVLFVQQHITSNQMRTHCLLYINAILIQSQNVLYINAILIQSQNVLISVGCINCQTHDMTLFSECHHMSEHFSECCSNCKWCDHAAHCFVHNNDILIVILNDENNNNVNEGEPAAQSRQITSVPLMRAIIIYVTP